MGATYEVISLAKKQGIFARAHTLHEVSYKASRMGLVYI